MTPAPGPHTPLVDLLGKVRARALAGLGLRTAEELLLHFPRRHEDRVRFDRFPDAPADTPVCIAGTVASTSLRRFGRNRHFEAVLRDGDADGARIVLRWFGLRYIHKLVAEGDRLVVYGRPRLRGKRLCIEHPEFEKIESEDSEPIHLDRLTPVHPAGGGASPRTVRSCVHRVLAAMPADAIPDVIPGPGWMPRATALREVHFPQTGETLRQARETLIFEEFLALQTTLEWRRAMRQAERRPAREVRGRLAGRFHAALPFPLTPSQERAIAEIRADLGGPHPMHRLLQGDVGSGKTVVALTAMLDTVESGRQAVLMAPTQILAEQHHRTLERLAGPLGLRVRLHTGTRRQRAHATGGQIPHVVIGTHALLHGDAGLDRLGLVVIDEQHKFGVAQRAALVRKGAAPDLLVLTATPIPRTLTMSLFGDLDVSVIEAPPPGRGRVRTVVRPLDTLPEAIAFVSRQLARGRQAYVVYPVIEEGAAASVKAAATEFEEWSARLRPFRVGLLHGRLPEPERDAVLAAFRSGDLSVLVATTVIEVGIDVPNATVMLVENAERFGLAQLHQLRGRIGRGAAASYCILLTGEDREEGARRLAILESCSDGFAIAEEDLAQRGPGDLLGTAQSGLPPLRLGDLLRDRPLMERARATARKILRADPGLGRPENQRLRALAVEPMNIPAETP